jgi:hypothetical protein
MPTQVITMNSVTPQPLEIPGGQATVTFTVTGNYTATIQILATPVGGGAPVVVGQVTVSQTSGNITYTRVIDLDTSDLDPNLDYNFSAFDPGNGRTSINVIGPVEVICFAAGTMIATARGEVPVESLRVGDLVVARHGGAALQPVIWLGHSRVDISRHPRPERVAPVRIRAGALAEGVPARDLRVSPDHGILLDGNLVPAGLLVNGSTIVQETWCPEVTYWHVELPAHGLLVSDGAVTESYLDNGNRHHFDNHPVTAMVKDFGTPQADAPRARGCLPVLREGALLDRIRARLGARAAAAMEPGAPALRSA